MRGDCLRNGLAQSLLGSCLSSETSPEGADGGRKVLHKGHLSGTYPDRHREQTGMHQNVTTGYGILHYGIFISSFYFYNFYIFPCFCKKPNNQEKKGVILKKLDFYF